MFLFGYYKKFKFVLIQKNYQLFYKDNSFNCRIYCTFSRRSMLMTLDVFPIFKFNFNCTDALFDKSKINIHGVYVIKKKTREEGFI